MLASSKEEVVSMCVPHMSTPHCTEVRNVLLDNVAQKSVIQGGHLERGTMTESLWHCASPAIGRIVLARLFDS